jgi:hypothetical protein
LPKMAFCRELQNAIDAECAIMQSHSDEGATWPTCQ